MPNDTPILRKRVLFRQLHALDQHLSDCVEQNARAIYYASALALTDVVRELIDHNRRIESHRAGLKPRIESVRRNLKELYEETLNANLPANEK